MVAIGKRVLSTMGNNLRGLVVGYGVVQWPSSENLNGDEVPQAIYFVQIAEGSSSLGQACVAMRADRVIDEELL